MERQGQIKVCAFVLFANWREAERAISLAEGRSWGGRKIQVNLTKYQSKDSDVVAGKRSIQNRTNADFWPKANTFSKNIASARTPQETLLS